MGKNFYRDLTDILKEEAGAYYHRAGNGSHEIWRTKDGQSICVPHNCKGKGTANTILKQAGLKKRF
ncbi:MAG: type II toxin-antitoxin system HicA family toxin [Alphaproteobacteria bacterium]|nr:MAG: type II toxin-antitoxin system HicA family toxin [Alphaproteobacteria bacterium]